MSKPMFAIVASGGQYDDAWSRAEFVTDDEDKGRAYCEKMNALTEQINSANGQIGKWQQHYLIDHPRPAVLGWVETHVPKWKGSDKVTSEMRAERIRIQEINQAASQASMKPVVDHNQAMYEAKLAYQATFPAEVQDGLNSYSYDTFWEIEPINWLE